MTGAEAINFSGHTPSAFIISENVNRRHLSKSQRAMAVAKAFPDPKKTGRGKKSSISEDFVTGVYLSNARTILRLAPDLVDQVLAGAITVDVACKQASVRKSESERRLDRVLNIKRSVSEPENEMAEGCHSLPLPNRGGA